MQYPHARSSPNLSLSTINPPLPPSLSHQLQLRAHDPLYPCPRLLPAPSTSPSAAVAASVRGRRQLLVACRSPNATKPLCGGLAGHCRGRGRWQRRRFRRGDGHNAEPHRRRRSRRQVKRVVIKVANTGAQFGWPCKTKKTQGSTSASRLAWVVLRMCVGHNTAHEANSAVLILFI